MTMFSFILEDVERDNSVLYPNFRESAAGVSRQENKMSYPSGVNFPKTADTAL